LTARLTALPGPLRMWPQEKKDKERRMEEGREGKMENKGVREEERRDGERELGRERGKMDTPIFEMWLRLCL